jgi:hypothetical protein
MSVTLTRRNVSAIAKLDFQGQGHAQRIDMLAKALGYKTGAALMSTLKAAEAEPVEAAPAPVRAVAIFGSSLVNSVNCNEAIRDEYGNIEGNIEELVFATQGELECYARGLEDADGWMDSQIICDSIDTPQHDYLKALQDDPSLSFVDWYTAEQKRLLEEYEEDESE